MKIKFKYLNVFVAVIATLLLFSACNEEPVTPDTVPIKAEIKEVIVKNSIYRSDVIDLVETDIDTVMITVPQGTDVTNLDLDILVSYFGSIQPQAGITNLTNPVKYTVTSNVESREVLVMANVVPPALKNFRLTSPIETLGRIDGNTITLEALLGTDLSSASFQAEFFGESITPTTNETIDLSEPNPTIKVINKSFENTYNIVVDYYEVIEFTGAIFDGTMHPIDFLPGSLEPDQEDGWVVEEELSSYKESANHFTSLADDNGQAIFGYGAMGLNVDPDETTTVFRAKGIADAGEHYVEIAFKVDGLRAKLIVRNDRVEIVGNEKVKKNYPLETHPDFDPTQWNTYRVTLNKMTREFKLYLNEDAENPILAELADHDPGAVIAVGDGGGKQYECLIDYMAFEAEGAYSPEDLPLNEIIK